MSVFPRIFIGLMLSGSIGLAATQAQAVSIGGTYDIDENLAISSVSNISGVFDTHTTSYPALDAINTLGDVWPFSDGNRVTFNEPKTAFSGSDPNASFQGTFASQIFNNDGFDIFVFESGDKTVSTPQHEYVAASLTGASGSWVVATLVGFLTQAELGGSATSFGVHVFGIDLAMLGIALGDSVSSLFFGNTCGTACFGGGNNPDVVWIGGAQGAAVAAVPVPAGLPLLGAGLGALGFMGWRKRRNKNVAAQA